MEGISIDIFGAPKLSSRPSLAVTNPAPHRRRTAHLRPVHNPHRDDQAGQQRAQREAAKVLNLAIPEY